MQGADKMLTEGTTGDVSHFLSMPSHNPIKMSKTVNTAHTNKFLIGRQGADVTHPICNPERRVTSLITWERLRLTRRSPAV